MPLRLTAVDERAAKAGSTHRYGPDRCDERNSSIWISLSRLRARIRCLLDRLADWCDRYTPLVALDEPHGLLLDMTGCIHLFGDERLACERYPQAASVQHGMIVRSALASQSLQLPRPCAKHSHGGIVTGQDRDSAGYTALPLVSLDIEENHLVGLKRAGLRSVGDVDVLPRGALTARFGARLVERLDAMFGRQSEPISPRRIIPVCMAERRYGRTAYRHGIRRTCICSPLRSELFLSLAAKGRGCTRGRSQLLSRRRQCTAHQRSRPGGPSPKRRPSSDC